MGASSRASVGFVDLSSKSCHPLHTQEIEPTQLAFQPSKKIHAYCLMLLRLSEWFYTARVDLYTYFYTYFTHKFMGKRR
jgi:hypothetical protein